MSTFALEKMQSFANICKLVVTNILTHTYDFYELQHTKKEADLPPLSVVFVFYNMMSITPSK